LIILVEARPGPRQRHAKDTSHLERLADVATISGAADEVAALSEEAASLRAEIGVPRLVAG
jgi:hypothetical protein